MINTKMVLVIFAALPFVFAWTYAHMKFWDWLADDSLWGAAGLIATSVALPTLGVAMYADWKERSE